MDQLINQSLDRYKIVALLGEGGMGAVFKARDVTLQREVAIKVMHPHFSRQPNFQERFLQEARTMARLNHPSIVQVYDFGQTRGLLYIVMKLIAGENLEKMLFKLKQQGKWITLSETLQIVRQVGQALDCAHREGILHRDIKPANIMIEPDTGGDFPYRPVLTDLGLAKLAEGGVHTQDGTSMGTPAYMSPEQALGQPTDARSDVYSMGVLLYELAVGQRPFPVKSITEAIHYHTQEQPPKPTLIRPDLPPVVEDVILTAMAKDPARRFQSAGALAKALEASIPSTTNINSAPTAMESAVSLITQYQDDLKEMRGMSVFAEEPMPAPAGQDRIQIMASDKTSKLINITKPSLTLGRDPDNDIIINDTKSSRHHARVDFDGSSYKVIDLNSTNGTFMNKARLLPGIAEEWTQDKLLQIGDIYLRLIRAAAQSMAGSMVYKSDGTQAAPDMVLSSPGEGRVGIYIENTNITLEPGQRTQINITILNQGPVVDHFRISVNGLPPAWLPSMPPTVQLMPGAQQSVTLALQPPRASSARTGSYPATVAITSQDNPNQTAEVKLNVTLAPYAQFNTEMFPLKVRAGKLARLTVQNLGNSPTLFTINWFDRGDELIFSPPALQVNVPEGQAGTVEFRAQPKQRKWIGGETSHTFTARVTAPKGEPQMQNGEVISRARIPTWVLPTLFTLCLIAGAIIAMVITNQNNERAQATQTAVAGETAVAQMVLQTAQAESALQTQLAGANIATQQAATQYAIVQGTANAASTQAAAVVQTATAAAEVAKNDATSTALAHIQETNDAQSTADAAAQMTAQAAANDMPFYLKTWINTDASASMQKLVIEKVDDANVTLHGYGTGTYTDWGSITVPFSTTGITGSWEFETKKTNITVTRSGDKINVSRMDVFKSGMVRFLPVTYVMETSEAHDSAMNKFIGTWNNQDAGGVMPQLVISKVDDFTLALRGYGNCTPTYCDWGAVNVTYTPPTLSGMWTFSFKTTSITATLSGSTLNVSLLDNYNDSRADKAYNYQFRK